MSNVIVAKHIFDRLAREKYYRVSTLYFETGMHGTVIGYISKHQVTRRDNATFIVRSINNFVGDVK